MCRARLNKRRALPSKANGCLGCSSLQVGLRDPPMRQNYPCLELIRSVRLSQGSRYTKEFEPQIEVASRSKI